ncbi:penicillin-binding protein, partial [Actinokineospora sp. PR83]|uniref:transglycosylase domain-containing protein n=1 Tax=Actinokineospora sp. PR83 TaxID=2884908 RepID=UPI001F3293CD
ITHREFDDDFSAERQYADDDYGPDEDDGGPPTGEQRAMRKKKTWRRVRRTLYVLTALGIVIPVLAFFITYQMVDVDNPNDVALAQDKVVTMLYADGSPMARLAESGGNRIMLKSGEIPDTLLHAVYAAEDQTFETNSGFDLMGIMRAVWNQATGGGGGGSTISQQYIKKASGNEDPTLSRKWVEVVKSYKMNKTYSKDDIIAAYLNTIYFGRGAYGIAAAAQAYYGISDVNQVTKSQAAVLAGMIQTPANGKVVAYQKQRWDYVTNRMISNNWMTTAEKTAQPFPEPIPPSEGQLAALPGPRQGFSDLVTDELKTYGITEEQVKRNGYVITLTIDQNAQTMAEKAVADVMAGQPANLHPALVAVDPASGAIRAYYGRAKGLDLDYAGAKQEPGSAFKPFDLVGLLEKGKGLGEVYDTTARSFDPKCKNNPYSDSDCKVVKNASVPKCGKSCTVAEAMKESLNVVFSDMVYNDVKPAGVAEAAKKAGILSPLDAAAGDINIAIGGGATQVTTVDMASAYATFAANGTYRKPHLVQKVTYPDGGVVFDAAARPELAEKPAFDAEDATRNQQIARNVTEALLPIPEYSKIGCAGGRQCAGKTGTHQYVDTTGKETPDNAKAWMVGYTPQLSTAVSMSGGDEKNTPESRILHDAEGNKIYGSGLPGKIWKEFMDSYHQNLPKAAFGKYVPIGKTESRQSDNDNKPAQTKPREQTSDNAPTTTTAPSVPETTTVPPEDTGEATTTKPTRTKPGGGGTDIPLPGGGGGGGGGPGDGLIG